jgi:hypothetical protein
VKCRRAFGYRGRLHAELDCLKPAALVDCCAELPIGAAGIPVHAVQMLDLLIPELPQIDQGVAAISQARHRGCTLVFCALGYSRSATIVVAWLVRHGHHRTLSRQSRSCAAQDRRWFCRQHIELNWRHGMNTPPDDETIAEIAAALLSTVSRILNGWSMVLGLRLC